MAGYTDEDVKRIANLALAVPADERGGLLERECRGNADLRARVLAMLGAAVGEGDYEGLGARPGEVLPRSPGSHADPTFVQSGAAGATTSAPVREGPGTRIGPYKLLQLIGEGGFGSVFLAEQERPVARRVALKIIKLGMDTGQVVARFEQERQALAIMDHPGIAKVLDAGATETGRPYFVMELCKGDAIADYCDKNNLSIESRLELFAQVCTAVQHAHTKGIIHRDIKPSNVLVSTQDGQPRAKVIDFGIAKATASKMTEKTLFTEHRSLIGTPEYMSPEQAEGSLDIDTRTDVYSLGVLLYELLTGSTPFSGSDLRSGAYGEIQRIIREVDPPKPSTRLSQSVATLPAIAAHRHTEPRKLGSLIRGELDWIVMKALEKDRARRYETANGLAADVRRYLSGEAVIAAPPSRAYWIRKFARRNRAAVSAGGMVAAALLIGVIAFAWQANVARGQRDLARAAQGAEAEQRKIADDQRDRALAAEAETEQRAADLAQVAAFQSTMLNKIDPNEAGERLMTDIRERFAAAVAKVEPGGEAGRSARIEAFGRELGQVNATDAAVELIDRTILKPAASAVDSQFKDQPAVDASLRHTLADVYKNLGRFDDAIAFQQSAVTMRRRVLGEDDPDTLRSINNLGGMLDAGGRPAEAEAAWREALEKRRRVLGDDDAETFSTMSNLGNLLRDQGKFAEAEPLLKAALDGRRRVLGNEHRETLISANTYGYLLIAQGKVKDAEPYWREAYETGRRVLPAGDRDVFVWTHNLGGLLVAMGRAKDAEAHYREALEFARRVRGAEHPDTLVSMFSVGNSLSTQGRYAEAEPFVRDALEIRRRVAGNEHPDTLVNMAGLGNVLRGQGKLAEAEAILRESLTIRRRTLGTDHPSTLDGMGSLARVLAEQQEYAEAEALYREALAAAVRNKNEDGSGALVTMNNLANLLSLQDNLDEAEGFLRKALEARRRVSGDDHSETIIVQSSLAALVEKQGKFAEAEALHTESLEKLRRLIGNDHPNTLNGINSFSSFLRSQDRLAEAEPLAREAASGFERVLGKDQGRTGSAKMNLGRVLLGQKRFAEAEPELIEAARVLAIASGVPAGRLEQCRAALATLYESWDRAEPGKGYDHKGTEWRTNADAGRAGAGTPVAGEKK